LLHRTPLASGGVKVLARVSKLWAEEIWRISFAIGVGEHGRYMEINVGENDIFN